MAAQGKNTGLTVGLIIAVVVALIASVAAFIIYREDQQNKLRIANIEREKENVQRASQTRFAEVDQIKGYLGISYQESGLGSEEAGTVLGEMKADIARHATGQGETTYVQVVENLDAQLTAERVKASAQAIEIDELRRQVDALESKYSKESQEYADQAAMANRDKADVQAQTDERVRAEQARRQEIEDQLASAKAELEEVKEAAANTEDALRDELQDYRETNARLRRELAERVEGSFTSPDGYIVNLQRSSDTVFLDIGARENLRPGVTFSVYDKDLVGPNGGDFSALKGSIEVLSVDETVAEARITSVVGQEPLSKGDPVYSPAWSPGRKSTFAFVGMIDLDGDGNFVGERNRLRRILNDAGAETSVYIDDDGNWVDGDGDPGTDQPLDVNTELLVLATIPDPSEVSDPKRKSAFSKMRQQLVELRSQAERNGIPVKNLKTFLDLVGHRPASRRYAPGQDTAYTGQNRRGNRTQPDPGSNTSGLYSPNRGRRGSEIDPQPSSNFNPR